MANHQKGVANIILIIVIVILMGVIGYFALVKKSSERTRQTSTPNPNPTETQKSPTPTATISTANWKIYRNNLYGFEVKYPATWELDSKTIDSAKSVNDGFSRAASYITIYPPDYLKYQYVKKIELGLAKTSIQTTTDILKENRAFSSTKNIGNYLWAIGSSLENEPGAGTPIYSFIKNGIRVGVSAWEFQKDRNVVEQILSTFKFIKSEEARTWQIYSNSKYDYSIRYPAEWQIVTVWADSDFSLVENNYYSGGSVVWTRSGPDSYEIEFSFIRPDPVIYTTLGNLDRHIRWNLVSWKHEKNIFSRVQSQSRS